MLQTSVIGSLHPIYANISSAVEPHNKRHDSPGALFWGVYIGLLNLSVRSLYMRYERTATQRIV